MTYRDLLLAKWLSQNESTVYLKRGSELAGSQRNRRVFRLAFNFQTEAVLMRLLSKQWNTYEAVLNTTEPQQASSLERKELREIERIKALIASSPKTLDNHSIALELGLAPDYVEKLCFDIYDGMIVEKRLGEECITLKEFDGWLKENNLSCYLKPLMKSLET